MISVASWSKLNLFLEVRRRRPDGFHELETVMLRTSLQDSLSFEPAEGLSLHLAADSFLTSDSFPLDGQNLILRAARALQEASGCEAGARISCRKLIPAEAGMAGGSGNCAATLLALNQLWSLDLPLPKLHEIAASLGSDINFFLEDCPIAVCRGRGEMVEPFALPDGFQLWAVPVKPTQGNSTPAVFGALEIPAEPTSAEFMVAAVKQGDFDGVVEACFNRLTQAARRVNPRMCELLTWLQSASGRPAMMSGSGATCFVLAPSQDEAEQIQKALAASAAEDFVVMEAVQCGL